MPDINRLKAIRTFPMLTRYLRDDLEWPIKSDSFEDITFEYEPEELGIEPKYANMIKEIRQLRPFTGNQPWGVFFINFDNKRLPVVVLRRILGALAIKKRASANRATQAAWKCNDLLFISTCGEEKSRSISFGHFQEREGLDLPALRVVGWDKDSTQLRLEDAQATLAERLHFPDDPSDLEDWRETWSSAFKLRPREVISTSKALAERLAEIAVTIRQSVSDILEVETKEGPMSQLLDSFRENLIHDLDEDGFADTYAQTLTYGLLTEKMIARLEGTSGTLSSIKLTNPFLSELLDQCREVGREQQQIDFDELGVGELEELLDDPDTRLDEVLKDFGRTATGEDPVLHFYELFLSEYDPEERKQRGVFYTPRPVVSYIVRSVHELLQTEFGLEDGLADTTTWGEMAKRNKDLEIPDGMKPKDPFVQILDPATGTATFLVETIGVIYAAMTERWKAEGKMELEYQALWNEYVPKHLLPRLHGYELMMAPYAIAHMKIGIKLYETGYQFKAKERARIYLTNALEPPSDIQAELEVISPALAHEAKAVNEIKHDKKFTVIIGNPPYSLISANMEPEQRELVERYKFIGGERMQERGALQLEKILNDDYVKFIAKSEDHLAATEVGILGFITNHAYLDNPTMRGLRHSLMESFRQISIYDLGGSAKKATQDLDENVFDIQQGVAISLLVRSNGEKINKHQYAYARLDGAREDKYRVLSARSITETQWTTLKPIPTYYLLVPTDHKLRGEYEQFTTLTDIFNLKSIGLFTSKDSLVIDWTQDAVERKVHVFQQSKLSNKELCDHVGITAKAAWNVTKSRERLSGIKNLRNHIVKFLHRPFDPKYLFYERSLVWSMAWPVNRNLITNENIALTVSRQLATPPWNHVFCSRTLVELCFITNKTKEGNHAFPLYVSPDEEHEQRSLINNDSPRTNIHPRFIREFADALGFHDNECDSLPESITPEGIFHYIYAVLHSPNYRNRYVEFLKMDFPRVPLTSSLKLFKALTKLGAELVSLHLMESPKAKRPVTKFVGPKDLIGATDPTVEKVSYSDETVWLDKAKTIGFEGVPEEVWDFHIGAYQVCEKWLKDRQAKGGKNPRPGRVLTKEDRDHYQGIIVALSETIRLMAEIDQVIDQHGGWPNAFKNNSQEKS